MLIDTRFQAEAAATSAKATAEFLAGARPGATTFYPEGSTIYGQGDPAGSHYMVEFGVVRICRVTADGRRQINSFHFAGDVFGFEVGTEHQFYAESVNGAGVRVLYASASSDVAPSILALALTSLVRAQLLYTNEAERRASAANPLSVNSTAFQIKRAQRM